MSTQHEAFLLEERPDGWTIAGYQGSDADVSIPASIDGAPVVLIAARAFEGNRSMQSLQVPESVTFIGNYAFASCPLLQRVEVQARIEALNLGTFWNCPALVDVHLPDSLRSINDGAFRTCTALESLDIPRSVTFIGDSVFRECSNLRSIILDGQVQTIERGAFRGCQNLSTVTVPTTLSYVGARAFQDCPLLHSVTLLGQDVDTTLTAFLNHGFIYLVADYAVGRDIVSFDEAKKLLNSKIEAERIFAARVLVAHPERLSEIFSKQLLTRTLAQGGCIEELRVLVELDDYLSEAALQAGIEAANAAGQTATAAYLLDALGKQAGNSSEQTASSSLRL